jgi:hypothetical protein
MRLILIGYVSVFFSGGADWMEDYLGGGLGVLVIFLGLVVFAVVRKIFEAKREDAEERAGLGLLPVVRPIPREAPKLSREARRAKKRADAYARSLDRAREEGERSAADAERRSRYVVGEAPGDATPVLFDLLFRR